MNREEFIEKFMIRGKIVPKRVTDSFIDSNGLREFFSDLLSLYSIDKTLPLSIAFNYLVHLNRCRICNEFIHSKHEYCSSHKNHSKKSKPASNRKFDSLDISEIMRLRENHSIRDIASLLGHDYLTIKKCLLHHGKFERKKKKEPSYRYLHTSFLDCVDFGLTKFEISSQLGVSERAVERIINETGVKPNPRFSYIDSRINDRDFLEIETKQKSIFEIAMTLNCSIETVRNRLKEFNIQLPSPFRSKEEVIVSEMVGSHDAIFNSKSIIPPYEIDIFIPSKNIAIEVNGIYWHSEFSGQKKMNYHLNKFRLCRDRGIELLQFWDSEIHLRPKFIKSLINSKLGLSEKLFARKTEIFHPSKIEEKSFFNENHRQGFIGSSYSVGLKIDDDIVSVMSFGKPRFNKNYEYELLRFASVLDHTVIGAASRLFKKSLSDLSGSIISYSDNRFGSGSFYEKLGFMKIGESTPSYFYHKDGRTLENRMSYQKNRLSKVLEHYDDNLSEWENMKMNGYDRVWDCGGSIWVFST